MKRSNFKKVIEFHELFDSPAKSNPHFPNDNLIGLRLRLIDEEVDELKEAIEQRDIVEVADALTDILYVVYGMGITFGIDLDECFNEVHGSNMSKLGEDGKPVKREDGKILKGPNFRKPDLKKIIFKE